MLKRTILLLSLLVVFLPGCRDNPAPTATPDTAGDAVVTATVAATETAAPTPTPAPLADGIVISEILPGVPGNNNHEFVELFNAGEAPIDLVGWSLWYQLGANQDEQLLYAWEGRADVPAQGHFLLARTEEEFAVTPDALFSTPLAVKGGLVLRDAEDEVVDMVGWGDAPAGVTAGSPAPAPADGASLERLPGGNQGNAVAGGDNGADFRLRQSPDPQNSGSALTPAPNRFLVLHVDAPAGVAPGSPFTVTMGVENQTNEVVQGVAVSLPVPAGFTPLTLPESAAAGEDHIEWTLARLAPDVTFSQTLVLQSPWTYTDVLLRGAYAEATAWPRAYGTPQQVTVAGGAIPIATARELVGEVVTVEGEATMYTGGFFAGSTGTKFYMEDETGGIQVYVPGGQGQVAVDVGDPVRVTGKIEVYRDSLELIPVAIPGDVVAIDEAPAAIEPAPVSVQTATSPAVLGELVRVEGRVTRVEEFSYSYEVDVTDETGDTLLVYVDKETGISAEPLEVGKVYRVTGIAEMYNGQWELMPRVQTDFREVFPPALLLEMAAPNSVAPGGTVTYTLTAANYTDAPLTDVVVTATLPAGAVSVVDVRDGGSRAGDTITWTLDGVPGDGGRVDVRYVVAADGPAGAQVVAAPAQATAAEWPDPATTPRFITFVGSGVPIWAIQGDGFASPYVRGSATTEGVVTGVFPELGGFWLQETETDDDPATPAGVFVLTEPLSPTVAAGDRVQISGNVRELSGQTLLHLLRPGDVTVLSRENPLPPPAELAPPQDPVAAEAYYESLEGMLVQVSEPAVAVAPTSQYGEYAVVREEWGVERVWRGEPNGYLIIVDDGSEVTHEDGATLPYAVKSGDLVADVVGPLAFTFGQYKIEPIITPTVTATERPLPRLAPLGPDEFSIATFNTENLFDILDPHPSSPPKPSLPEYRLRLQKTADAIVAMGTPTVVALQEVENVGILEDLAAEPAIAEVGYVPVLIEGTDSRGIDVGYLVRGDQAEVNGARAFAAPEGLTSRPPLLITVTLHLEAGEQTLYVINNHFTSLAGGEEATEPRRTAQADWNADIVDRVRAHDPAALVAVVGDLNSFYNTLPINRLQEAGLQHVYEFLDPGRAYTYIFEGQSQTLDHILLTPNLYEQLARVEALHIDADYPPAVPDDPSARRTSDHDPLVAVFVMP